MLCLVIQLCPTLSDPMDHSLPGSSFREDSPGKDSPGFSRILEWIAQPSSRGSSQPNDQTQVSHIAGRFFFFKLTYFNWRLITLQYCSVFCHTMTWISHACTYVLRPELPSSLPQHPIPQGHPSAPDLKALSCASKMDWRSISYMIIYMFQCYSLKSSHPRLPPTEFKSVLYICVSFAVSHVESSLPSF